MYLIVCNPLNISKTSSKECVSILYCSLKFLKQVLYTLKKTLNRPSGLQLLNLHFKEA